MLTSGCYCKRDGLRAIEQTIPDASWTIWQSAAAVSYDVAHGLGIKMRRDGKD